MDSNAPTMMLISCALIPSLWNAGLVMLHIKFRDYLTERNQRINASSFALQSNTNRTSAFSLFMEWN